MRGEELKLFQNKPNPYSRLTEVKCVIPSSVKSASLVLYDLSGTQLKSIEIFERGEVVKTISESELQAGMYLYSLIADNKLIDTISHVIKIISLGCRCKIP